MNEIVNGCDGHSRLWGKASRLWRCDVCAEAIDPGDRMIACRSGVEAQPWLRAHPRCARHHEAFYPQRVVVAPVVRVASFVVRNDRFETKCRWCDSHLSAKVVFAALTRGTHHVTGWLPFHPSCVPTVDSFWVARADYAPPMLSFEGPAYEIRTREETEASEGLRPLDELMPESAVETFEFSDRGIDPGSITERYRSFYMPAPAH